MIKSNVQNAGKSVTHLHPSDYALPIIGLHLLALLVVWPALFSWLNLLAFVFGVFIFGQGINLGYHRLLAHRSLQVPRWLEYFYVGLALCCMEETPAKWVATHRRHHANSDTENDPHSTQRGFWWAHMGWLLFRDQKGLGLAVDVRWAADILKDPLYMRLERRWWLPPVIFGVQAAIFFLIGMMLAWPSAESFSSAMVAGCGLVVWGVLLRTVVVWHITWSVNSLTHYFGYQTYQTGEESRNNWLVALFASGEGWHNNHHHDPASASVQHKWWEFDPTYYHIKVLEWLGLAHRVIRPRFKRQQPDS
jgi:stearoyl-CoA desaturase (delta-9 desaturase)